MGGMGGGMPGMGGMGGGMPGMGGMGGGMVSPFGECFHARRAHLLSVQDFASMMGGGAGGAGGGMVSTNLTFLHATFLLTKFFIHSRTLKR